MKKKILLDTNFLVAPFQFSLRLFEELERLYPHAEIFTIEDAVEEAKSIRDGKFKELVPQLIENQEIKVLETEDEETSSSRTVEGEVDDLLVEISDEYIIATNDRELKQRIKDKGRPVIMIRQKNHLEVENRRSENP